MKSISIFFSLFLSGLFLLSACGEEQKELPIQGDWQGVSWSVNGKESARDASSVSFSFSRADNTYRAALGSQVEKGRYRLSGEKLYTTAEGKAEKMVQIALPSPDTLLMQMNRQGDLEELILVKRSTK
jgi:hypothetical protein